MKKRLLSLALCLALCLGLLPVGVLATEIEPSDNVNNVASVTIGENVAYYTDLAEALAHADGGTVKLLNNVFLNKYIDITSNCTIDLNSKTISGRNSQTLLNICGNVTICDESTQKPGKVINSSNALDLQNGKLTIKGGTFEATDGNALSATSSQLDAELSIEGGTFKSKVDIYNFSSCISGGTFYYLYNANVIADLLKDGCGFQQANGSWLSANDLGEPYAQNVTVVQAPISGITVKSYKDTYSYGEDVTLTANASSDTSTHPTYQWYRIRANTTKDYDMSVTPVDDATNPTCVLTDLAPNYMMIGGLTYKSYLYYCAATYGDYATGRSVQFTVKKANLKDATITLDNSTYAKIALDENGNLIYALTGSGESIQGVERTQKVIVTLNGKTLTEGTDYTITGNTGTNAGTYTLKIQAVDGSPYYTGSQEKQWSIVPLQLSALSLDQHIKVYDGTIDITAENSVFKDNTTFHTKSGDRLTLTGQDFTILNIKSNFTNPNAYIGGSVTYTVKLHNPNYTFTDSTGTNTDTMTFTQENESIQAAPAPEVTKQGTLTVANRHAGTYTFDLKTLLPELPAPQEYGTTQYELTHETNLNSDYYTEGATISNDGILSLPINRVDNSTEKEIGNIHVKVNSQNFLDFNLTLNVSAANKKVPTGTPTLSKATLTYGDKLSDITLSGSMKDGDNEVAGTFTWKNPNEILTAGKHQAGWVFTPTNRADYIEVTGESEVTVAKATPSGTPSYTAITESGKTLEDAHLAVGTLQPEGFIQWVDADGNKINVSTEVKANTAYTWKFTPYDENYTDLTGTITLWHKSSSSSSSGAVTPGTKTDTVKNPDGSTTKTETKADGSKTETTTASSGGGSTGTTVTKTDAKGNTTTEASAKLSDRDVKEAQEKGEAVSVPVKGIAAAKDANAATKIKIDVPNNANKTTVEIPVENVTSGTVAVIVHEDGTEELVKDSKPTEHGVQLELSGSTTVKIIDNSKTFDDTKEHWSRDEVNFVAARELFNGVGGNQFGVSQPMTRGMVNTVLARLAGVDTTPGQGQAWYEVGTDWAKKNGISDGTNPTAPVTREQLATLLYRYAGSPSVSGTLHAADAASVSDYAEDALLWANQNGIVNGVGSNTIAPKDNAQRAQVAAMLARYLQNQ